MIARKTGLYKPRQAGTLKAAVADLVDAVGGLHRTSDLLGRSQTQVARYTDHGEPDHISVDQVRILEQAAHTAPVTAFLAQEAGCVLLPVQPMGSQAIDIDFARVGQNAAELFAAYGLALGDKHSPGIVDAKEAGELIARSDDLMRVVGGLRKALETRRDAGAPLRAIKTGD
jgi:hypothetical protein